MSLRSCSVTLNWSVSGNDLISALKRELRSGNFSPGVPLTMEVPKSFRIRVAVQSKRFGPNYSRPGSILLPRDRLLYQCLADQAAPIVKAKTDAKRSFSHQLAPAGSASMFLPTRTCWNELQKSLAGHAKLESAGYILKIDVANFFGSLNQHTMINLLNDSGYPKSLSSRLEAILTSYTGERSSRGILQGMYPSDLLGNYYLAPIDQFLDDYGVPSARYVDDIYVFLKNVDAADQLIRQLIPTLRSYDLVLNEAKSVIMPKSAINTEEPDLEALFADAVAEIAEQIDTDDLDVDYGFQSEWDDEEPDEETLELRATTLLFDSLSDYPGHEENIERFCLPIFSKTRSEHAVKHVLDSFKKRPSMSQIYASYLANFLENEEVHELLLGILRDALPSDWQKLWVLAALSRVEHIERRCGEGCMGFGRRQRPRCPKGCRCHPCWTIRNSHAPKGSNVDLWIGLELHSSRDLLLFSWVAWRGALQCKSELEWARSIAQLAHELRWATSRLRLTLFLERVGPS
jgi:hypothetical protein